MSTDSRHRDGLSVLNVVIATPKARGGAVRAGLQFGAHLDGQVSVNTMKMQGDYDDILADELGLKEPINQLPSHTFLRDICSRLINSDQNYSNALIWTKLNPPQNLQSYDLVHIHNAVPLAGMLSVAVHCWFAGVPYCVSTHGISKIPDLPESMEMPTPVALIFRLGFLQPYWWVLRNAAHLFALSERDAARLRRRFADQSISVLPNGVTPNPPSKDAADVVAERTSIASSTPLLLFVGKLLASKGVADLLTAYEQLDNSARLVLVGPLSDQRFADQIDEIDGAEHLGYVDQLLLDNIYQRADVFVFPTRSDVFPLVTLEAMAAQTPVVTTSVGGLSEQVTDQTGVLVPARSPERLAIEIDDLLADDERRALMGEQAFKRVQEHFSWERIAMQAAAEYDRIIRTTETRRTRSN